MTETPPTSSAAWRRAATACAAACLVTGLVVLLVGAEPLAARLRRGPGESGLATMLAWAPEGLAIVAAGLLWPAVTRRPALLAAFVSVPVAGLMVAYHLRPDGLAAWDGDASLFYRMAADWPWRPAGWWRYRVLVPWLVSVMPFAIGTGYALVALVTVAAGGPLTSLLLRDLGHTPAARHAGVGLYLSCFAPLYNTFNYALPDPAAMAVLLLAARALVRRRDKELALWIAVGVVTKEVSLFLLPARWLFARRAGLDLPEAGRTLLIALPAAVVFVALRFGTAGELADMVTGTSFLFPWTHQADNVARLYSPFAAGWALALVGLRRPDRWTVAGAGFAVPVALSLLFTDSGRMLVYLLPFAIPAMLRASDLAAPGRKRVRGLWAVALAALSMRLWEPFLPLAAIPELVRRAAALLLFPVVAWLAPGVPRDE
jgi:hypothetical protein